MADDPRAASGEGGAATHEASGPRRDETRSQEFVSLYRRFRPGTFAELRGQPHVVRALQGAVRDERVAHAYLFSGPRGTGKTSTARILARALNCADPVDGEPCGVCVSCVEIARGASLDVHELDAASNNGVDAMRDLISHAALATPGRWKVYIVDEVHMLSNAAANALLKTLEEPPGHVVFVLATTDPQKVPPTIRSRTQHFEFGLLPADTLTDLLEDVRRSAGLELADDAISAAVRKGRGSARDALSALDQVAASGSADALRPEVVELTEALVEEDSRRALVAVAVLAEAGWGPQQLAVELVDELRQVFLAALAPELCEVATSDREQFAGRATRIGLPRLVRAIEALGRAQVDMREAPDARAVLEVALVRLTRPELDDSTDALLERLARVEETLAGRAAGPTGTGGATGAAPRQIPSPVHAAPAAPSRAPAAPSDATPEPAPRTRAATPDAEPTAEVTPRPGFGALRRQRSQQAAGRRPDGEPSEQSVPSTPLAPDLPQTPPEAPLPSRTVPEPSPSGQPAAPRLSGESRGSGDGERGVPAATALDRDAVVQAWGDHILRGLPAKAKVLYSAGRFVGVEGSTAVFGLPNAIHRDRCEEVRGLVEDAISARLGSKVALRLVVDAGEAAPRPVPGGAALRADNEERAADHTELGLAPDDDFDPDEGVTGVAIESMLQARLLDAFPGAEEVGD